MLVNLGTTAGTSTSVKHTTTANAAVITTAVVASSGDSGGGGGANVGAIAGGVIGAVVVMGIVGFFCWRKRPSADKQPPAPVQPPYSAPQFAHTSFSPPPQAKYAAPEYPYGPPSSPPPVVVHTAAVSGHDNDAIAMAFGVEPDGNLPVKPNAAGRNSMMSALAEE
ncbi:hypothetical protein HDU83_001772 [Entophlyctis luteolus]|nr:hypothetical protein HDU83_001772 [Entophlyctis luteolus]